MDDSINNELKKRRQLLDAHYKKFRVLKRSGKLKDALEQLNITLNCALESLTFSTEALARNVKTLGNIFPAGSKRKTQRASKPNPPEVNYKSFRRMNFPDKHLYN